MRKNNVNAIVNATESNANNANNATIGNIALVIDNTNKTDTDKLGFFKRDVVRMGIEILPPDVNKSQVDFSEEKSSIRYALSAIRNVGEGAMRALVLEREKNGPFKNIMDLIARVDNSVMNKRCLESLIKSGALDCLEPNRAKLHHNLEKLSQYSSLIASQRRSSQISLFGESMEIQSMQLDNIPEWPSMQKLEMEAEVIGFYLSAHPLDAFESSFERLRIMSSSELFKTVESSCSARVRIAGIINDIKERTSQKSGSKYAFITASDMSGTFEMMCFSELLSQSREKLKSGQPLIFSVLAEKKEEQIRIIVQSVEYLNEVITKISSSVMIYLSDVASLPLIQSVLKQDAPGKGKVFLIPQVNEWDVEIALEEGFSLTPDTVKALRSVPGVKEIRQL